MIHERCVRAVHRAHPLGHPIRERSEEVRGGPDSTAWAFDAVRSAISSAQPPVYSTVRTGQRVCETRAQHCVLSLRDTNDSPQPRTGHLHGLHDLSLGDLKLFRIHEVGESAARSSPRADSRAWSPSVD